MTMIKPGNFSTSLETVWYIRETNTQMERTVRHAYTEWGETSGMHVRSTFVSKLPGHPTYRINGKI